MFTEFECDYHKIEQDKLGHYLLSIDTKSVYLQGDDSISFEEDLTRLYDSTNDEDRIIEGCIILIDEYSVVMT